MLNPKIQMYEIKKKAHSVEYAFLYKMAQKRILVFLRQTRARPDQKTIASFPCVSRNEISNKISISHLPLNERSVFNQPPSAGLQQRPCK
jgi:hypothetical protein